MIMDKSLLPQTQPDFSPKRNKCVFLILGKCMEFWSQVIGLIGPLGPGSSPDHHVYRGHLCGGGEPLPTSYPQCLLRARNLGSRNHVTPAVTLHHPCLNGTFLGTWCSGRSSMPTLLVWGCTCTCQTTRKHSSREAVERTSAGIRSNTILPHLMADVCGNPSQRPLYTL